MVIILDLNHLLRGKQSIDSIDSFDDFDDDFDDEGEEWKKGISMGAQYTDLKIVFIYAIKLCDIGRNKLK